MSECPTQKEIVERLEERSKNDFLGFEINKYIYYLDYEHAKPYLKEGVKPAEWNRPALTKEHVLRQMQDYMEFAWDKAKNCRGISAGRSISHYIAWIWLKGDHELLAKVSDDANYEHYGKNLLVMICDFYGWDSKQWDDGIRVNSESELESAYATKEALAKEGEE